ncbi:hypothetical protein [Streptosporangium sp. NPDC000396]|uniref:hypothetical protein n=1 Tax=Streptosporangium sp. NPDC000396 TaxID=3366185 RepID=UPI0036BA60E8
MTAHNLTAKKYQVFWEKWAAKGYVETVTAVHGIGPATVFAIVMEKRQGGHQAYFGVDRARLRLRNTEAEQKGYIFGHPTREGMQVVNTSIWSGVSCHGGAANTAS